MLSHISFLSIPVTDQDRALAFWRDVVGCPVKVDAEYMPGQRWIMLNVGEARTAIHLDLVETMPPRGKPVLPLIADVEATVAQLREHGATIVQEPAPAPWDEATTFAMFDDSEGNLILLSSK